MASLLPHMPVEPPPGFVAFVERHLEPLRRDALRIVDDDDDADEVSGAVLTDVALRWRRFELLRVWLGRVDPAGAYLPLAFARRSAQWKGEPGEVEVEVWSASQQSPGARAAAGGANQQSASQQSAAVRIALVRPPPLATVSVLGEAAVAWWHAYEAHVRHRRIAAAWVGFAFVAALVRLHNDLTATGS